MGITTKTGLNENGQSSSVFEGRAIGDIIPHFGTTAPPGTLVCDGSEISRETYHELYEEIGALVGQGDGSTTFNLPDLRGKWMMGADAEHAVGEEVAEGLPDIVGVLDIASNDGLWIIRTASGAFTKTDGQSQTDIRQIAIASGTAHNNVLFNASNSNSIYGAQSHVTPASVAVLPCIVFE